MLSSARTREEVLALQQPSPQADGESGGRSLPPKRSQAVWRMSSPVVFTNSTVRDFLRTACVILCPTAMNRFAVCTGQLTQATATADASQS